MKSKDPHTTFTNFLGHRLGGDTKNPDAKRYINQCSTDATASYIVCNMQANGDKNCGLHMPTGGQISADALAKFKTWVECGAPEN